MFKGIASYMVITVILGGGFTLLLALSFLIINEVRIGRAAVESVAAYYAAEAGIEDILLRLQPGYILPVSPATLSVGSSSASVTVGPVVGGTRIITADGTMNNKARRVEVVATTVTTNVNFFYGAQVGEGGLVMDNNAIVDGNVFSNGNVSGGNGSNITGTLQVSGARPGAELDNVDIGVNAYVDECTNASITGTLHANGGGNCSYGSLTSSGLPISPIPLPLSDAQIQQWKNEAEAGGVINGNYILSNGQFGSLGPRKVTGELIVDNNATLEVTGIIWVVGKITIKNGATVRLAASYGSLSGMMISNDLVLLDNGSVSTGSGAPGSYLMYISTSASSQAIEVKQGNTQAAIVYTNTGAILLDNGADLREATGYRLHIKNNAVITYETGLADVLFSSGPGGRWTAATWQEVP